MSTNILENMIAQAEQAARARAAQALADEETERNRKIASARAGMEEALAPELWRAMGIDLDELTTHDGAPTVAGEFEIAGHALIAVVDTFSGRRDTIRLRIILAGRDVCGRVIDREHLTEAQINPWISHRDSNAAAVAEALRRAVALAPDARIKMAARVRKEIDDKIGRGAYRSTGAGAIDRSRALPVKAKIILAAPVLDAGQVAELRSRLCKHALQARRDQANVRRNRDADAARAAAEAAITEAARQYAPIYAQYEQAARTWAQEATRRAWDSAMIRPLWIVRYGRVTQETDEDGSVYNTEPEEIVTPDAGKITNPTAQNNRYHSVTRVEFDGSSSPIIIANVIDLVPYAYGEITTAGTMAYCRTVAAQPAGVYVNIPHGSDYQPPAPPTLSEAWIDFCHRTTGHAPAQTWRAYLDDADEANQADRAALQIPF